MAVVLNLKPETEADLTTQARASGMPLEEFVLTLVESAAPSPGSQQSMDREQAVRGMIEFGQKYRLGLGEPISRDLLQEGHRF